MTTTELADRPLTVAEAATWLQVSPSTIYALCAAGRLAHFRVGLRRGSIRINKNALLAFIQQGQAKAVNRPHLTLADLRQAL